MIALALNYAINHELKPKTTETILLDFLREEIITLQEFKTIFMTKSNQFL